VTELITMFLKLQCVTSSNGIIATRLLLSAVLLC